MQYNKNEFIENTASSIKQQSVLKKITYFFKKMFKNNKDRNNVKSYQSVETNKDDKKQDFQNSIKVERDLEEERLLSLQKQFENNIITEEEISENDKVELKGLYYMQILKSKIKIKIYKEKLSKNGIVEGIENKNIIDIQWNPEYMNDTKFFEYFINKISNKDH